MDPKIEPNTNISPDLLASWNFDDLEKITEENLGFSAITDGLGFHPKQKPIAAKTARAPVETLTDIPARSPDPAPIAAALTNTLNLTPLSAAAAVNAPLAPVFSTQKTEEVQLRPTNTASPKERALAMAIDVLIVSGPILFTFLWNFGEFYIPFGVYFLSTSAFMTVVFATYLLIAESLGGQSLGKMLMGIVVVEDDKYRKPVGFKTSARRLLCFFAGLAPLGLGSLYAIWDSKYLTWHDRVSASLVEKKQS